TGAKIALLLQLLLQELLGSFPFGAFVLAGLVVLGGFVEVRQGLLAGLAHEGVRKIALLFQRRQFVLRQLHFLVLLGETWACRWRQVEKQGQCKSFQGHYCISSAQACWAAIFT